MSTKSEKTPSTDLFGKQKTLKPTEGAFAIWGDVGTEVSITAVNKLNKKLNEIRRDVMEFERQFRINVCQEMGSDSLKRMTWHYDHLHVK